MTVGRSLASSRPNDHLPLVRPSASSSLVFPPRSIIMVKITVQHRSSKAGGKAGKPPVTIDFPHRHPNKVTVLELKGALEAKFPKVSTYTRDLESFERSLARCPRRFTRRDEVRTVDGQRSMGR